MKKDNLAKTENLILCGLFTALIAVGAFIRVPVPFVPFTLQVLFVFLAGILLGKKLGAISALLYMILGLIGIPIFTQGGGLGYFLQPTFGYIIGFCIASYVVGLLSERDSKPSVKKLFSINLIGLAIVYATGVVYFYNLKNYVLGESTSMWTVFIYGAVMCAPGDIVLCLIAGSLGKRLKPLLKK